MKRELGFTLIEVMVVVAVIGILTAISLPSYTAYIQRSHRTDAKTGLLAVAQRLEQNFTLAGRYDQTQDGATIDTAILSTWGLNQSPAGTDARYNIAFTSISSTGYVIKATPFGAQASDSCGVLSLSERNLKAANGQDPNTAGVSRSAATIKCWSK